MARRKRRLLIPDARQRVDQFKAQVMNRALGTHIQEPGNIKMEVAKQLNIPLRKQGNGQLKSEDAGKIGGAIGGRMVKEMIRLAQESLSDKR
jgi:hypothetical protein